MNEKSFKFIILTIGMVLSSWVMYIEFSHAEYFGFIAAAIGLCACLILVGTIWRIE